MSDTNTSGLYRSIHAQPGAVRELLTEWDGPSQAAELMAQTGRIFLSGIGTSFHAATVGEYLLRYAGADAWALRSFEFVHYPRPLREDDGVIVISHRGSKLHGNLALQRTITSGVSHRGHYRARLERCRANFSPFKRSLKKYQRRTLSATWAR